MSLTWPDTSKEKRLSTLILDRRSVIAGAASLLSVAAQAASRTSVTGAIGDFDFQEGRWHVRHRSRSAAGVWRDFKGECSMRKVLGGQGNVEEHVWELEGKVHRAMGLRTFDPALSTWSIFWLDSRWPSTIGPPVVGGFDGKRGTFYADEETEQRPSRSRFLWLVDDRNRCRWEQGSSLDAGITWDTNWYMSFTRL